MTQRTQSVISIIQGWSYPALLLLIGIFLTQFYNQQQQLIQNQIEIKELLAGYKEKLASHDLQILDLKDSDRHQDARIEFLYTSKFGSK